MRTAKVALSVIALVVAAGQYALVNGMWNLHPAAIGIFGAVATFFFALGIQPISLSPRTSAVLGSLAGLIGTVGGVHAAGLSRAANPHPFIWATVSAVGILCGAVGRLQSAPAPAPKV